MRRTSFDERDRHRSRVSEAGRGCVSARAQQRGRRTGCNVQLEFFSRVLKTLDSAWPIVEDVEMEDVQQCNLDRSWPGSMEVSARAASPGYLAVAARPARALAVVFERRFTSGPSKRYRLSRGFAPAENPLASRRVLHCCQPTGNVSPARRSPVVVALHFFRPFLPSSVDASAPSSTEPPRPAPHSASWTRPRPRPRPFSPISKARRPTRCVHSTHQSDSDRGGSMSC